MATILAETLSATDTGYEDDTSRWKFTPTGNALSGGILVTFEAPGTGADWADNCAVGIWDGGAVNRFECNATPLEILFDGTNGSGNNGLANGGHGFQLAANGTIKGWAPLTGFTTANKLIIIKDWSPTNGRARIDTTPVSDIEAKNLPGNSYNTPVYVGTGAGLLWAGGFNLVETYAAAAGGGPSQVIGGGLRNSVLLKGGRLIK